MPNDLASALAAGYIELLRRLSPEWRAYKPHARYLTGSTWPHGAYYDHEAHMLLDVA